MTDHLETYRQMVRSMRFSPPLSLTHLSQATVHRVTTVPVDSLPHPIPDTHWQLVSEPPTDPSEYTAALIHQAVGKPTVLPITYTILENIGDRISRLTVHKPTPSVPIPFKIPQADPNATLAQASEPEISQAASRQSIENTPVVAVAQPVVVEDTALAEVASGTEPVVEEELLDSNPVIPESVDIEETPIETLDNSLSTDVIAESTVVTPIASDSPSEVNTPDVKAQDNHTPTLLERVSSVVEAVSNVWKNADPEHQNSDVVEEIAPPASVPTEALATAAPVPTDEAEETSAPTLLEKVSSAVESVVTSLKNVGVDQKNSEAEVEPALAKNDTLTSEISEITCPKCHSTDIRKNGHRQDKQRYICKDCRRQFVFSSSVKEEHNSALDESAAFETSTVEDTKTNTDLSQSIAKESKHNSKKKPKAKGFGNSKAK